MVGDITKKVVILKDIHSNMIEEVILILKGESQKEMDKAVHPTPIETENLNKKEIRKQDILCKEATLIVENYIKECKMRSLPKIAPEEIKKTHPCFMTKGAVINLLMLGSILLLAVILTMLF